jgi:hypothetical protein
LVSPTTTTEGMILSRRHKRSTRVLLDDHAMTIRTMAYRSMPYQPTPLLAMPLREGAPRVRESRVKDFNIAIPDHDDQVLVLLIPL